MSDNSHDYQVSNDVPVESVNTSNDVESALTEKLFIDQAAQHQNSNDIEKEQKLTENEELEESEAQEPQQKDEFSSKFAALSRKEKEIRSREAQLEQKLAEFEAKMEQLSAPKEEPKVEEKAELPLEYRLRKNPIQTLEELGLPYEALTKMVLNDGEIPADMQMRLMREEIERDYQTKFEQLENKLTEKEKAEEEQKYNQTIENFKSEINEFVDSSEQYELIGANDAYDLVYEVIEQYYEENGRILDTAEAADQVEQYLEEELTKVLKKSKKLGSWRSEAASLAATPRQSPTLSNSLSAQGAPKVAGQKLSEEESFRNAASLIKWDD